MYSGDLRTLVSKVSDKNYMIKLSLSKDSRAKIEEATSWMNSFYVKLPLKIRCLSILNNYTPDTFPTCENCGAPVGYEKAYLKGFNSFCSDKCAKEIGRLPVETKEKLNDYDWLFQKRVVERLNYVAIGELLGCSSIPPTQACKKLGVPMIKLTESISTTQRFLMDKKWLIQEHTENHRTLSDIAEEIGSSKATLSVWLKNHDIQANPTNSYDRKHVTTSKECQQVIDYIKSISPNIEMKVNNRRTLKNGKEIDILLPSLNIGFEYNGIYSHIHSHHKGVVNCNKIKSYHLDKTLEAAQKGIELIHIFSDDWVFRKNIVKSIIAAKIGVIPNKIFARKCEVVKPSIHEKVSFLNNNHIQGKDRSSYQYSLKYNGETVAMMTFCKSRFNKNADWELSRFAVQQNSCVVGGFSKLLSAFRKEHAGSIISYADRSRSHGAVYSKNGFELIITNPPGYHYVHLKTSIQRLHRGGFMKKKIAPNDPRAEWEVMFDLGYKQIYDCGTLAFLLK